MQVEITLTEFILRATWPNGECCENLLSNTEHQYCQLQLLKGHADNYPLRSPKFHFLDHGLPAV